MSLNVNGIRQTRKGLRTTLGIQIVPPLFSSPLQEIDLVLDIAPGSCPLARPILRESWCESWFYGVEAESDFRTY